MYPLRWSSSIGSSTAQWISHLYMHTVEYYTTVKRNALLLPAIRGMNFTDITLSRRSQIQRSSHGKFNLYKVKKKKPQNRKASPGRWTSEQWVWRGHQGGFWHAGHILYFDLGVGMWVHVLCKRVLNCTFRTWALLCMYFKIL